MWQEKIGGTGRTDGRMDGYGATLNAAHRWTTIGGRDERYKCASI